jgi:hypothetical protein
MLEAADQDNLELLAATEDRSSSYRKAFQPGNRPTAGRDGRNGWEVERGVQSAEDEVRRMIRALGRARSWMPR